MALVRRTAAGRGRRTNETAGLRSSTRLGDLETERPRSLALTRVEGDHPCFAKACGGCEVDRVKGANALGAADLDRRGRPPES